MPRIHDLSTVSIYGISHMYILTCVQFATRNKSKRKVSDSFRSRTHDPPRTPGRILLGLILWVTHDEFGQ